MMESALHSIDHPPSTVRRLTGSQAAAIAVFELHGPRSMEVAAAHLRFRNHKPLDEQPWNRIAFGFWKHPLSNAERDGSVANPHEEDVVFCRTGANDAELHTHGSSAVAKSIFGAFRRAGVTVVEEDDDGPATGISHPGFIGPLRPREEVIRLLEPSWWETAGLPVEPRSWPPQFVSKLSRAQLPERLFAEPRAPEFHEVRSDASQTDANIDNSLQQLQNLAYFHLCRAKAHVVGRLLWRQVQGALLLRLWNIADQLQSQPALAKTNLDQLLATWSFGRFLSRDIQVLVTGAPNVGKSSLINALLGYERSVVSDTPGTTRDLVGQSTAIAGWQFRLLDSAGLRQTNDDLEEQGIRRVALAQREADLILKVRSADQPDENRDSPSADQNVIHVCNKVDLLGGNRTASPELEPGSILVSATTRQGIDDLMSSMVNAVMPGETILELTQSAQTAAVVFAPEVYEWLSKWRSQIATA
ncbi:MAG: 50S ribosome-binding GTPase [Planctomycetaceae bacterium]|nr:50S ribosome-binding GTPase [Planctomycetaceae bacterium]